MDEEPITKLEEEEELARIEEEQYREAWETVGREAQNGSD